MAEFSKEFLEKENWSMYPDFSIIEEFNKLQDGESAAFICEGFGFHLIKRHDDKCVLVFRDKEILLEKLLT
jgi:hypothetical protein